MTGVLKLLWEGKASGEQRLTQMHMPGGHPDPPKTLSVESEPTPAAGGHCRQQHGPRGWVLPGQQVSGRGQSHHGVGCDFGQESWAQGIWPRALRLEDWSIALAIPGEMGFLGKEEGGFWGKTQSQQDRKAVLGTWALQKQVPCLEVLGLPGNPNLAVSPRSAARRCVTPGKRRSSPRL